MRIIPVSLTAMLLAGLIAVPASADENGVLLDVGLTAATDAPAVLAPLGDAVLSSRRVVDLPAITVSVPNDQVGPVVAALKADPKVRYVEADPGVTADGTAIAAGTAGDTNQATLTI